MSFDRAVQAIVTGDAKTLQRLLKAHPKLVRARSKSEHHSTLLHYVSANGVEGELQKTPKNIVAIARMLLDAGADVNAESDAYGGGCTTLGLVATSVHPQKAGVQIALMKLLIARGAAWDKGPIAGHKNSIVFACIANGQPDAARFFAHRGAAMDLCSAAALGRLAEVKRLIPQADAEAASDAVSYAAGYGQVAVTRYLLDQGLRDWTAIHWAASGACVEAVKLLLRYGADADVVHPGFKATPLEIAQRAVKRADNPRQRQRARKLVALLSQHANSTC